MSWEVKKMSCWYMVRVLICGQAQVLWMYVHEFYINIKLSRPHAHTLNYDNKIKICLNIDKPVIEGEMFAISFQ